VDANQIVAGARSVVQVSRHFEELKAATRAMLESYDASRRGYFTPTEDEQTRHLLVSYWQSRNALIETVYGLREAASFPQEMRSAAFLVGFSGALVLVDAARYLSEQLQGRPVAKAKLNEPEPYFGIPQGAYDQVQASLTSPLHVWHLYHAVCYFDKHAQALRGEAQDEPLAALMQIIDRLHDRIQVGVREYALARMRVDARRALNLMHRDLLGRALYGLQKAVSRLVSEIYTIPTHHPQLPAPVSSQLRGLLQPGDVLITRKDHALTNYFLPGYWPHAALYLGTCEELDRIGLAASPHFGPRWLRLLECDAGEPGRVLEAMKDGVWIRSVGSPFGSDALAVIRPKLSPAEIAKAIDRGMFHEGKPYDFDFDFTRSDRLVCTEVVYRSYEGVAGVRFQLTRRAGRLTLAAEDLLQMALSGNHFEPIAAYCPQHTKSLATGGAAEALIRKTCAAAR
jgi:Permuted papain-like amidase enzyme, YaeF/YiiX, C92 family